jgi:hypothetical protein
MKHNYYLRYFVACFTFLCCFSATVLAQGTSPAPQDFTFFTRFLYPSPSTTILLDFRLDRKLHHQGSYATTGTLGADRVLVANSTAATSGNIIIQWKNWF